MSGDDEARSPSAAHEIDQALTVTEAAARLGVTVPRLRRLLARPEWSARTGTRTRTTATGTRTSVSVPVLLLPDLADALEAPAPKPASDRTGTGTGTNENAPRSPSAGNEGNEALLAHLTGEVAYLRERLAESTQTVARLSERLEDADARLALMLGATDRLQIPAQTTPEAPERGAGGEGGKSPGSPGNDRETKPWWKRLFGA